MSCTVEVSAECQVVEKDAKGAITGTKWAAQAEARKEQLVRVVAKMTGTCKAKITFDEHVRAGRLGMLTLHNAPGAPDSDKCTKYREIIYWAIEVHRGAGDPVPEATFTATADCADCECEDAKKQSTDSCVQKFTDRV